MVTVFQEKIYAALRKVPAGKVITYAGLGKLVGSKAFRAVGMAMRCNPYAPVVPCHRVVCSDGSLGGFKGKTSGKEINEKITHNNQFRLAFAEPGFSLLFSRKGDRFC